jgi:DNA repair exonuclease SbcCD ATPase subunit/DNA repair exonuclease SbcCD nuclease subunit
MHIIHLADLHIRSGNLQKSRYIEYESVFNCIIQDLENYIYIKDSVIFILGDIFHNQVKIESAGLKLSLEFIKKLSNLAPVYIIRGNHDYLQAFPDEPDLISSVLSIDIPNVTYLNKTGHYTIGNIGIGLISIQDALQSGNTQGITPDLPAFPDPNQFLKPEIKHKIAIFHGPIGKAKLPNGTEIMEHNSYPLEWFKGYDYILLGDIHLQQVNNAKLTEQAQSQSNFKHSIITNTYNTQPNTWAYPGSTIQQDFGESLLGHGFLIWDLDNQQVNTFHVKNDYGFVTVKLVNSEWLVNVKNKWLPLIETIKENRWFPKDIYLRIKKVYNSQDTYNQDLINLLEFLNINILEIRYDYTNINASTSANANANANEQVEESLDLSAYNSPKVWIEYLEKLEKQQEDQQWKAWFTNHDTLMIPSDISNKNIQAKIKDKNEKFAKLLTEYKDLYDDQINLSSIKKPFNINYLEWDYILCYRNNNYFNFDNLDNISAITANNACGKSSFLETICIALFGEGFPSRHNKTYSASIICQEKPDSSSAKTVIYVTINNIKYIITRVFSHTSKDANKLVCESKYTTLDRVDPQQNIHSGKTAVDAWVKKHIGSIEAFLLSSMISQNLDKDFFNLKSADQKELLDNALSINVSTKFHNVLKEAKLSHSSIVELTKAMIPTTNNFNYEEEIQKIQQELNDLETKIILDVDLDLIHQEKHVLYDKILKLEYELTKYPQDQNTNTNVNANKKAYVELLKAQPEKPKTYEEITALKQDIFEYDLDPSILPELQTRYNKLIKNQPAHAKNTYDEYINWKKSYEALDHKIYDPELDEKYTKLMYCKPTIVKEVSNLEARFRELNEENLDLETIDQTINKVSSYMEKHKMTKNMLNLIEDQPYNAECWACQKQTWKVQKELYTANIVRYEKILKKYKPLPVLEEIKSLHENIQAITKYNTWEQEYQDMLIRIQRNDICKQHDYWVEDHKKYKTLIKWNDDTAELEQQINYLSVLKEEQKYQDYLNWTAEIFIYEDTIAYNKLKTELTKYTIAHNAWDNWQENKNVPAKISELKNKLILLEHEHEKYKADIIRYTEYTNYLEKLEERLVILTSIYNDFGGFTNWLYTNKVIPALLENVNHIIKELCDTRPLALECIINQSNSFDWFLRDNLSKPPIEKASGFQKFIIGIAIRIALGSVGISGIKATQLYIDEGFVSFDTSNLSKVNGFLLKLLDKFKNIILVSHLEEINNTAKNCIYIRRGLTDTTSQLQFGDKYLKEKEEIKVKKAVVLKKK